MRSYEELRGAEGKRVYYRAERYKARDLFKRLVPEVRLDSTSYSLCDVSMNGLAAYAARGANHVHEAGERLPVRLDLRGMALHEGIGEVSRVEPTPLGTKVGIRLLDQCLNIGQLVTRYQEIVVRGELDELIDDGETAVAPEYRQFCADVLYLLRTYRAALDRFAQTNPQPAAAAEMLAACEERILPRWRTLWRRGNELVLPIMGDPAALRATKQFTEFVLTPEIMAGAIWKRSYEKPLGYPGDFQVMNMVYAWQREGSGLYDQLMHRIGRGGVHCHARRDDAPVDRRYRPAARRRRVGADHQPGLRAGP
jgi:extracellular factor (EF) 3-hydroxypalmitic acid methyl ester biosynthesis protein